jgi:hypothetical protein
MVECGITCGQICRQFWHDSFGVIRLLGGPARVDVPGTSYATTAEACRLPPRLAVRRLLLSGRDRPSIYYTDGIARLAVCPSFCSTLISANNLQEGKLACQMLAIYMRSGAYRMDIQRCIFIHVAAEWKSCCILLGASSLYGVW